MIAPNSGIASFLAPDRSKLTVPHGGLVLQVEAGGTWRLDAGRVARRLLGERVRVEGIRDGFDLLAVDRIGRA